MILYSMRCVHCGQVVDSKYADPAMRKHPCREPVGSLCSFELIGESDVTFTPVRREPAFVSAVRDSSNKIGLTLPIGDWTEASLSAIGITKTRVAEWAGESGCGGCQKRQEWLNKLGGKLAAWIAGGSLVDEAIRLAEQSRQDKG